MRTIESSTQFKRDFKREAKGPHRAAVQADLPAIVADLANDVPLAARFKDHELKGDWQGYRDCHIKPDLLLIYRKVDGDLLRLARLGSHAELFG